MLSAIDSIFNINSTSMQMNAWKGNILYIFFFFFEFDLFVYRQFIGCMMP